MNFGTLKSRILALIGRAPNDLVYELVTADINQTLRLRVMESTTTLTEAASVTLPSDFLEVVSIYRDTDPRSTLQPTTEQTFHRTYETSGVPRFYSVIDGALLLSPAPNGSENIVMRYIAQLADLSADTDTNDVLTKYPGIYVYGALVHHAALIRDAENAATWLAGYDAAKRQAQKDDRATRYGGVPIVPVVKTAP